MRRASDVVASAAHPTSPAADTWVSVALTYQGLKALGVPNDSLDSFAPEFRARYGGTRCTAWRHGREQPRKLGKAPGNAGGSRRADRGGPGRAAPGGGLRTREDGPPGFGRGNSDLAAGLLRTAQRAKNRSGSGTASAIRRSKGAAFQAPIPESLPSRPANSFSAIPMRWETSPRCRSPEVLGRNGTYIVFRKLHQRVAAFRQYLKANSSRRRGGGTTGGQDDGALAQRCPSGVLPVP